MDAQPIIYVNGKPFLGRVEEQKQFRAALKELLHPPKDETLPYIFLLYGDGGIGKTTLTRRFRDIACEEPSFEGKFEFLWVDWEDERKRFASLRVGRQFISPEAVFDVIFTVAQRNGLEKHFAAYQRAVEQRKIAEKKAAEALSTAGERDEFAPLRSAGAGAIAGIIRMGLPTIGTSGENLAKAFLEAGIKIGAEQAAALRAAAEHRLRARLGVEQFDLYINPNESLARALADGLKRLAAHKPLIIVLDTYEIVDRADTWLRMAMQAAGANLLWVVSGRDDLVNSRQFGSEYFKGYAEDFPRRLISFDVRQLALEDVKTYFAACAPGRPLEAEAADAVRRATRGIPLAMQQAAEMWEKGMPLEEIVGDTSEATPQKEIVAKMTGRYLLHAVASEDCRALYALTLARGDVEILREMLRPAEGSPYDLETMLRRMERDYASVYAGENRLHDEPALFFHQHLKEPLRRTSDEVQTLNQRAVTVLYARLARMEASLPRIEDRGQDEDWVKAALDLAYYLFWLDEEGAWKWLAPRFVEGLAYNRDLHRGLIEIANEWKNELSQRGRKRFKALQAGAGRLTPFFSKFPLGITEAGEAEPEMVDELEHLAGLGWLGGEGEAERCAILAWQRGQLLYHQGQCFEALALYKQAAHGLPAKSEILREKLGEAYENIGNKLGWLRDDFTAIDAIGSKDAELAYTSAIALGRKNASLFHGLGAVQYKLGNLEGSRDARLKAIELNPKFAYAWNGLGNVYRDLDRHDEAITAYQMASELDPKDAYPWNGLGNVYRDLDRHDEAIAAFQKAVELDPKYGSPHNNLADIYMERGDFDKARHHFEERIRLAPQTALNALVSLGVMSRHQGTQGSDDYFKRALEIWENTWKVKLQTPAGLLENKALALLCLDKKEQGLKTLHQALEQRLPGDKIEFYRYELLESSPLPPEGIGQSIEMLKAA